ncbi:MAG: type III-B CRISPR module-associated protein Cmr3 [Gammaproteobacteria bacterium]
MNDMKLITFEPLDSLFFREAKPFNAGEGGFLDSQFPPSAQTLSGAIRGAIGEAKVNWDWSKKADVAALLGTADNPAPLSFAGPYLFKDGRRLYPVPLNLLYSEKTKEWTRLTPSGTQFTTDMGDRQLPTPEKPLEGAKPIEEGWLNVTNMEGVLKGELPTSFIPANEVFVREARAGIGRDNQKSVVNERQLYFTRHLRLQEDIALGMAAGGAELPYGGMVRLGGEGRLARIVVGTMPAALDAPPVDVNPKGLILTLLTHGDFGDKAEPDWERVHPSLELVTACVGKAVREGGWDYAQRQPKPLKSLVPAGSCYFVQVNNGNLADVIAKLHGKQIGQRTKFGYGEIAVGLWK